MEEAIIAITISKPTKSSFSRFNEGQKFNREPIILFMKNILISHPRVELSINYVYS